MDTIKKKILTEAEALFMRLGLKSVSMDDIARKLGMSKKTLYQYVNGKEDLIDQVMEANGQRDMEMIITSANESSDAIDEFLRNSRHFIREMRNVSPTTLYDLKKYYLQIWENQVKSHIENFVTCISVNITRGQAEGLYRADTSADIIARFYGQTVIAITDTSLFPAVNVPIDQIIHQHAVYHLHGIMTEKGRLCLVKHLEKEQLV
jgi:AcrR family transcriptional regulator